MSLSTLYMLTFKQQWGTGGPIYENVFFYDHTAGDGVWSDLGESFGTAIAAAINAIQANLVLNVAADIVNMGVPTDFGFTVIGGAGAYVDQALPPHSAIAYTQKVNTRAVRKGSKRFSGVPETVQANGLVTDATYLGHMETLRLALQEELVSADDTWLPVVVKRIKTAVPGTTPVQYAYRLPTVGDTLVTGEINAVLTSPNVKHQVSRKL